MFKFKEIKINTLYKSIIFFLIGFFFIFTISPVLSQNNNEQINNDSALELVEKARVDYQNNNYTQARNNLQSAIDIFQQRKQPENLAISYTNLGTLELLLGETDQALNTWQKATKIYQQLNDYLEVSNSLILQGKALNQLSLYPRACNTVTLALKINKKNNQEEKKEINCQQTNFTENFVKEINNDFDTYTESNYLEGLILLGNILRKLGRLSESEIILSQTLAITQQKNNYSILSTNLLALGDTLTARGNLDYERSLPPKYDYIPWQCQSFSLSHNSQDKIIKEYYQKAKTKYDEAIKLTTSNDILVKAQLQRIKLLLKLDEIELAKQLLTESQDNISRLSETNYKIYAQINYAKNWACILQKESKLTAINTQEQIFNQYQPIINLLEQTIKQAENLNNNRVLSYSLGNLGGLYEYLGDYQLAEKYTQSALYLTQARENFDLAYQWQWQLARLFEAKKESQKAIKYYENAVQSLRGIRSDLLTINTDVQFSFRDNVEPLYRNLVSLLLASNDNNPSQENLWKSIYYIDDLQLAELENFLQCDLQSQVKTTHIYQQLNISESTKILQQQINNFLTTNHNKNTAFIYTLAFKDKVSVILKLPNQPLIYQWQKIDLNSLENIIKQTEVNLKNTLYQRGMEKPLNQLYQLLLSDLEPYLQANKIKTLVFIADNNLRQIPMAALYDGNEFIIENKYAVTLAPTTRLLSSQSSPSTQFKALLAGSLKLRPNFDSLESAIEQIKSIQPFLPSSDILVEKLGKTFTKNSFQNALNSSQYNLIHLVTHGQSSSDPENSYILTDDDSDFTDDYKLTFNEFGNYLNQQNQAIDLLVLSACETAEGDKRAVLGIAGIAVKSGSQATIAPLWTASQEETGIFMERFYDILINQKVSKAEALRLTQKSFLRENDPNLKNPRHWALFVLVGYNA